MWESKFAGHFSYGHKTGGLYRPKNNFIFRVFMVEKSISGHNDKQEHELVRA